MVRCHKGAYKGAPVSGKMRLTTPRPRRVRSGPDPGSVSASATTVGDPIGKSLSLRSPLATARMTRSVSSGSSGAETHVRRLRSTNSTLARNAQLLLPSGSGWFLTRCQHRTAAFVAKSGVGLHVAEAGLRRGQRGFGQSDALEVGDRNKEILERLARWPPISSWPTTCSSPSAS